MLFIAQLGNRRGRGIQRDDEFAYKPRGIQDMRKNLGEGNRLRALNWHESHIFPVFLQRAGERLRGRRAVNARIRRQKDRHVLAFFKNFQRFLGVHSS